MWLWSFGRAVILPFYRLAFRIRVEGRENVPPTGGVILCANHISGHDPPLLGMLSPRNVRFMAKEELFKIPIIGWFAREGGGAFPVKRGTADRASLKRSLEVLEEGGVFGIFPEGTRNRTGTMGPLESGTAYLALKSGAKVVPVGFSSTYKLFRPVIIRFGAPIALEEFAGKKLTGETLEAANEAIRAGIQAQLEPPTELT